MKVYVVQRWGDEEQPELTGVYTSLEAAQASYDPKDKRCRWNEHQPGWWSINNGECFIDAIDLEGEMAER